MGNPIVKLEGEYLIWSTIVDSFVTFGMTLEGLEECIREEYGNEGARELPRRLARVEEKGTSAYDDESAEDTILVNRAGPNEGPLHREEIVEFFVRRKEIPLPATLAEMRSASVPCSGVVADGDTCIECWGSGVLYPKARPCT